MSRFFLVLIFVSHFLGAQTVQEVLNNVNKEYSKKMPLSYKVKYNLYKSKEQDKIYESYNGFFKKNEKNEIYQKIDQTELLWNNNFCLKVIHPDKLMTLSFSQPISTGEINMNDLYQFCSVKSFNKKKDLWELTLEPKAFSGLPYSKIVVWIDKKYFIKKQLFYYNTGINFSGDYKKQDVNLPVLEILYSDYNRNAIENSFFNISQYLTISKDKITVSDRYKGYILDDQREITIK